MEKTFYNIIKSSYDFNQATFDEYYGAWSKLSTLYNVNFLNAKNKEERLPKKIHQIWLGGKLPDAYKRYADSWVKFHPDWEYKLWGDEDIYDLDLTIGQVNLFQSIQNPGQRSDFMRYHILNKFGGLYIDTDFECLTAFNSLLYLDFFTGVGFPIKVELYIGLIACIPHHPIMEHIVNSMTSVKQGGWKEIFDTTGSYFFTKCFFESLPAIPERIVAFPYPYFYPFPNQSGYQNRNGYDYIQECSYAIHHWAVAWSKKNS